MEKSNSDILSLFLPKKFRDPAALPTTLTNNTAEPRETAFLCFNPLSPSPLLSYYWWSFFQGSPTSWCWRNEVISTAPVQFPYFCITQVHKWHNHFLYRLTTLNHLDDGTHLLRENFLFMKSSSEEDEDESATSSRNTFVTKCLSDVSELIRR